MSVSKIIGSLALWAAASASAQVEATQKVEAAKADLQLRRITLFSSGVGYFERAGTLSGSATVDLQFRTEQINDILKSLVIEDFDGGSVDVVTYSPKDPLERTLQSFGVKLTGKETLAQLLDSLRGQRVRIAGPRQLTGTILGVEKRQVLAGERVVETDLLNILAADGMQQLPLAELQGVQLLDEKTASELNKALAALAATHDTGKKTVSLKFTGDGQRRVRASFLLETPIWKTSYRLVLVPDAKPFIQGWAIVENTTDEDWKDVQLSLVSGRPISFVMDLYTPIYLRRPVEDLELYASLRAPQFEAGIPVDALAKNVAGEFRLGRDASSKDSDGEEAVAVAREVATPAAKSSRRGAGAATAQKQLFLGQESVLLDERGVKSVAEAQEAGELFEYVIETPVSINRQQSAMLPIVNGQISGEKLSIFNPQNHSKHPLNGLKIKNTTELNLMQGPVTIFDGGIYAGDAKLPDLKPGEERLVAYALDLGTDVTVEAKSHQTQIVSLSIDKGTLIRRQKAIDERTYKLRNKQARDKTVLIEQRVTGDWQLLEPAEPFERTDQLMRFKISVPANQMTSQPVRLQRIYGETVVLTDLDLGTITHYISAMGGEVMSDQVREALQKVVSLRTELDRIGRERRGQERQLKEAGEEQERIRKNLQVLQQNTDSYRRQLTKLDTLETQIEELREQVNALRKQEEQQRSALQNYLSNLTIEDK